MLRAGERFSALRRRTVRVTRRSVARFQAHEGANAVYLSDTERSAATIPQEQFRELLRLRGKAGLFRTQAEELAQLHVMRLVDEGVMGISICALNDSAIKLI